VEIVTGTPVTVNDPALTEKMLPTLRRVAGAQNVSIQPPVTASEDFSFFAQKAPGLFVFLGSNKPGVDPRSAPVNHSPLYDVDELVLPLGVRTLAHLAVDYLAGQ
jgi:amidohydrolase